MAENARQSARAGARPRPVREEGQELPVLRSTEGKGKGQGAGFVTQGRAFAGPGARR